MKTYFLTVFKQDGTNILDEKFEAANDEEAKKTGTTILEEKGFEQHTHRCVAPDGRLILFHR